MLCKYTEIILKAADDSHIYACQGALHFIYSSVGIA